MFNITSIFVISQHGYFQDMVLLKSDIPHENGIAEFSITTYLGQGMEFCKKNFPDVPVKFLGKP